MKKKKSLFIACLALALLCTVHCTDEDLFAPLVQTTLQGFSLEEAQTFFREQAEKYATLGYSLDDESRQTLSPGDFVPEWEEATASVQGGLACYNVPIVPTYHFKAVSVEERGTAMQASKVNVYQKLVIVKELSTGRMSQYILTLVPTPSYDARNGSSTAVNFVNCGEKQGYSGLAVYTCVYTPFTARVSRYEDGKRVQGAFLLAPETRSGQSDTAVDLARALTASVMVRRGKIVTTRFEDDYGWDWDIDGGELPEVVVTPDYDWDQWLDDTRPDGNVDPEPEENYPEDPEDDQYLGGDDNEDSSIKVDPIIGNIASQTNMNSAQLDLLKNALTEIKNTTIGGRIYELLVDNGVKLAFNVVPRYSDKNAYFAPGDNSITFMRDNCITSHALREELVHAVQYNVFYGASMTDKLTNFDFEAKVIADVTKTIENSKDINTNQFSEEKFVSCTDSGGLGMIDNAEYCEDYKNFIGDIILT